MITRQIAGAIQVVRQLWRTMFYMLIEHDLGLLRFRQAVKSTLALLIAVSLTLGFNEKYLTLFVGFVAVFSSVEHTGENIKQRQLSMLWASMILVGAIYLGFLIHRFYYLAYGLLPVLSFCAFYIRRFGERFHVVPSIAVVLYVLAIAMKGVDLLDPYRLLILLVLSATISFVIYFFIWPERNLQAFRHTGLIVFAKYAKFSYKLSQVRLFDQEQLLNLRPLLRKLETKVHQQYDVSEALTNDQQVNDLLNRFVVCEYALYKVLAMVYESLLRLSETQGTEYSRCTRITQLSLLHLQDIFQRLEHGFISREWQTIDCQNYQDVVLRLKEKLSDQSFSADHRLVYYANLCFGLQRLLALFRQIQELMQERQVLS